MGEHLTDDQRVALELRYFEFLSVEEVSQRTGWTKSNVTTLCQRGYKRLREVLTESMWSSGGS
jgi:RNA polymerase sigma factor (sigma-70 family)